MEYKFTILGRPLPKKNNPIVRVIPRRGAKRCKCCNNWTKVRFIVSQPKRYRDFEKDSALELLDQKNKMRLRTIKEPVHCKVLYWIEDLRMPDLQNLQEATADILQASTIIKDDRQIISWDGSRIVEIDRENPRQEIFLREVR